MLAYYQSQAAGIISLFVNNVSIAWMAGWMYLYDMVQLPSDYMYHFGDQTRGFRDKL